MRASPLAIRPLLLALLLVFASFPAVSWANLLSFRIGPPERELVEIDPTTGAGTLLTAVTPTRDIQGLAFDSNSGILYGADHVSDSLYVIDPTSGVASLVGAFTVNVANVGLAYDVNQNVLFMSHTGGSASKLFSVDTATGVATQIGADFGISITGLGYDSNSDTLYGMGSDFNLYTLDTTTGALSAPIGSMGFIQGGGLTYDAVADILYATDSSGNLWTLNTSTGAGTLVGPIGNTFHGALANTFVVPFVAAADDVSGISDISNDTVPDLAYLTSRNGRPIVRYYSGADLKKFAQVAYLSKDWTGVAAATLADANQDGVADDPAVAVLGRRLSNDRLSVQVRLAAGGAELARINFLNNRWTPVDVVVIDDANGDGVSDDTAIGVLGFNPAQGSQKQTTLQVRRLSDDSLLREVYYNNTNWTPLAAGVVQRTGQSPLLAVLAEKNSSKEIRVQARLLSDGTLQRTKRYLNDQWRGLDLAILKDTDGNGVLNDASYMVLAVNPGNGLKRVQVRRTGGALVKNVLVMNDLWQARRILGSDDINGNLVEELGVLGNRISDGKARIELTDFDTEVITGNIFP